MKNLITRFNYVLFFLFVSMVSVFPAFADGESVGTQIKALIESQNMKGDLTLIGVAVMGLVIIGVLLNAAAKLLKVGGR